MVPRALPALAAVLPLLLPVPTAYAAGGADRYESLSSHLPARQQVVGNVSASADLATVVLRARHWWVRADGEPPVRLDLPAGAQVCDVSADGSVLLWREAGHGLDLPAMHVLDLATGDQTTVGVPDEAIATWCGVVSEGGSRVAYSIADAELGGGDGWARGLAVVWTRETGAVEVAGPGVEQPKKPWPPVVRGISDDGRYVLYLAPSEGPRGEYRGQVVVRWDTLTGDQVRLSAYRRTAVRAAMDAAGDTVAWNDRSWSRRERVYVAEVPLDAGSGDPALADVRLLADDTGRPTGVRVQALSPDGRTLVHRVDVASWQHELVVQDLLTGTVRMARTTGPRPGVPQVWAVADGGRAALMTSRERLADRDRPGRTRDLYLWTAD